MLFSTQNFLFQGGNIKMFMYLTVLYNLLNDTSIITEITNAEKLNFLKYSKLSLFLGRKTIITTELSNSFTLCLAIQGL